MERPEKVTAENDLTVLESVVEEPVKIVFPEVARNGKFQAVKVGTEYVVYNPDGARVSGTMSLREANDIVIAQNRAAHLKG
jgi:hypothetical protein